MLPESRSDETNLIDTLESLFRLDSHNAFLVQFGPRTDYRRSEMLVEFHPHSARNSAILAVPGHRGRAGVSGQGRLVRCVYSHAGRPTVGTMRVSEADETSRQEGPPEDGAGDGAGEASGSRRSSESSTAPEAPARDGTQPSSSRYLNRELSRLDFNARVVALAENRSLPVLERAKFL